MEAEIDQTFEGGVGIGELGGEEIVGEIDLAVAHGCEARDWWEFGDKHRDPERTEEEEEEREYEE